MIVVSLMVGQMVFASTYKCARENFYPEPPIPDRKSSRTPELGFVTQRLDNFDPTNNRTWEMVCVTITRLCM